MKIPKEDMLELRALDAEMSNAQSTIQLAQRAINDAQQVGTAAMTAFKALHTKHGIDAEKHTVLVKNAKQQDGTIVEACTVINRADNTLYDPDAKVTPIPINRAQRRAMKKQ